jgi:hypothetical protein
MPDITSVLERAAAEPTRAPDVATPLRRRRWERVVAMSGAFVLIVVVVFGFVAWPHGSSQHRVEVSGPMPRPTSVASHGATIKLQPGWVASSEPLNWWIGSPFELFSLSTSPLPPSRHDVPNDAACPSEIPNTVAENLPLDGAYLWITLWGPFGVYQTQPWPPDARDVDWSSSVADGYCKLARGLTVHSATVRRGDHDLSISYVVGPDTSPSRKAEINAMLDTLDVSAAPPTHK